MAFEVRPAILSTTTGRERPSASAFTDADWRRLLALAGKHGFDPDGEYEDLLYPERDEARELHLVAAQELAVALSEVLREETSPRGEILSEEVEDEQRGWVYTPEHGWRRQPMIRVGPPERPELQVGWTHAKQLSELVETGPIAITRVDEPIG